MISFKKLFQLMEQKGKNQTHIREEKIIGQETLRKLKIGTGVLEEYDYRIPGSKDPKTKEVIVEKRTREISVDTKSIESLCIWLDCQPSDIMEVIPNTWNNVERLLDALNFKKKEPLYTIEDISKLLYMVEGE